MSEKFRVESIFSFEKGISMAMKQQQQQNPNNANLSVIKFLQDDKPTAEQKRISEDHIRAVELQAYRLWEKAGRPDGEENRKAFWFAAEKALLVKATQVQSANAMKQTAVEKGPGHR